jgi:hypothetical protein
MNPRRVAESGGGWMAAMLALSVSLIVLPGVCRGQTNRWMAPFSLESSEASYGRTWSGELHQFLLQSPGQGIRPPTMRLGATIDPAHSSTNAAVTLRETQEAIAEARMDQIVRRIDEGGYGLPSASARRTPTVIDRGLVAIFSPEPIRIGRAELGFSPYTAIKRRNPFCLLNPIPLSLSW